MSARSSTSLMTMSKSIERTSRWAGVDSGIAVRTTKVFEVLRLAEDLRRQSPRLGQAWIFKATLSEDWLVVESRRDDAVDTTLCCLKNSLVVLWGGAWIAWLTVLSWRWYVWLRLPTRIARAAPAWPGRKGTSGCQIPGFWKKISRHWIITVIATLVPVRGPISRHLLKADETFGLQRQVTTQSLFLSKS